MGANQAPSNVNNLTAVLFLWTILPGYAAASYMPTIVLERPLFVRCAQTCLTQQRVLPLRACPLKDAARRGREMAGSFVAPLPSSGFSAAVPHGASACVWS